MCVSVCFWIPLPFGDEKKNLIQLWTINNTAGTEYYVKRINVHTNLNEQQQFQSQLKGDKMINAAASTHSEAEERVTDQTVKFLVSAVLVSFLFVSQSKGTFMHILYMLNGSCKWCSKAFLHLWKLPSFPFSWHSWLPLLLCKSQFIHKEEDVFLLLSSFNSLGRHAHKPTLARLLNSLSSKGHVKDIQSFLQQEVKSEN